MVVLVFDTGIDIGIDIDTDTDTGIDTDIGTDTGKCKEFGIGTDTRKDIHTHHLHHRNSCIGRRLSDLLLEGFHN